jgi:hypothetical protein
MSMRRPTTIQAALSAIPDAKGGHRIVIRPDTYEEANLYPSFRGAAGSYNLLVGDHDGKLGSGATGWVLLESSCPGVAVRTDPTKPTGNPTWKIIKSDLPETGLRCVDWWGDAGGAYVRGESKTMPEVPHATVKNVCSLAAQHHPSRGCCRMS